MINNHTKKSNHPKFFIKIKNMFQKKSYPVKIKINYHNQALKNQKKKNQKKKEAMLMPKKRKKEKKKEKEVTTGNEIAQKKEKKKGNVTGCLGEKKKNQGREKKEKKCNLN